MPENSVDPQTAPKRGGSRKAATFDQERVVRRYLSGVDNARPGRGLKRTSDAIGNRITKIDEMLVSADPLSRVHMTQERIELHAEYVRINNGNHPDPSQLERDFVRVARSYGDRNGITFAAWRQVGVDAKVLERAGIYKAEKKPPPAARAAAAGGGEAKAPEAKAPEAKAPEAKAPETKADETKADEIPPTDDEQAGPKLATKTAPASPAAKATDPKATEGEATEGEATEGEATEGEATEGEAAAPSEATVSAGGVAGEEPTESVSMDELAALLADASVSSAAGTSQPTLGEDLGSGDDPSTRRRKSRPAADD